VNNAMLVTATGQPAGLKQSAERSKNSRFKYRQKIFLMLSTSK
jgi:hypothetical protein